MVVTALPWSMMTWKPYSWESSPPAKATLPSADGENRRVLRGLEADVDAVGVLGAHRAGEVALGGPDEPRFVGDADADVGRGYDDARRCGRDWRARGHGGDVLGRPGGRDGLVIFVTAATKAAEKQEVDRGGRDADTDEPRKAEHDLVLAVWVHSESARTNCLNPEAGYTITCSG